MATASSPFASRSAAAVLPPAGPAPDAAATVEGLVDPAGRPRWARPALAVLLVATAAAYVTNLSASGYGNDFYAAAVQAGTRSWKAFLFGSLDSSNFITVDKPPAALWVMELSARIFGFHPWSVMLPNVAEGVVAVALVYGAVRRVAGTAAGLAAGLLLAATPVAALMFRFDNPDALLVALSVGAAYCVTRAVERAGTRWMVAAGALVGFAFLTKMLQAFTVVPAFGVVYLVAAPTGLRRRLTQLLAGGAALVLAGGWWVALVALTPAADRPYVDGSPDNSILNLIFVYNGFGRLSGNGSGGGGGGPTFSGAPGPLRLFNAVMGGQAAWLLPAAAAGLVVVLVARRRAPRTDTARAAVLLWGTWLVATGAVFSLGRGIIHTYYTVALAPAIAALVAIGGRQLWMARRQVWARLVAAGVVAATAALADGLLDRTPHWAPVLRTAVVLAAVAAVAAVLGGPALHRARRVVAGVGAVAVAVAGLGGPVAYAASTIASAHTGSIPSAGPATSAAAFGAPGGLGAARFADPGAGLGGAAPGGGVAGAGLPGRGATAEGLPYAAPAGGPPSGSGTALIPGAGGELPGGAVPGGELPGGAVPGGELPGGGAATRGRAPSGGGVGGVPAGGGFAGGGGGSGVVSRALARALDDGRAGYRWVAAVNGSQSAASLELATGGAPVMAIGGFSGQGGNLPLVTFEADVARHEIHYFVGGAGTGGPGTGGPGAGGPGGGAAGSAIASWVAAHYRSTTIGGETVYDLAAGTATRR